MKHILVALAFTFSASSAANADDISKILTHYTQFQKDYQVKDYDSAAKNAYKAWQAAEESIGDHPKTGALAQNYANQHYNVELEYNSVFDAYKRSIELASSIEEKEKSEEMLRKFLNITHKNEIIEDFKKIMEGPKHTIGDYGSNMHTLIEHNSRRIRRLAVTKPTELKYELNIDYFDQRRAQTTNADSE